MSFCTLDLKRPFQSCFQCSIFLVTHAQTWVLQHSCNKWLKTNVFFTFSESISLQACAKLSHNPGYDEGRRCVQVPSVLQRAGGLDRGLGRDDRRRQALEVEADGVVDQIECWDEVGWGNRA